MNGSGNTTATLGTPIQYGPYTYATLRVSIQYSSGSNHNYCMGAEVYCRRIT